MTVTLTTVTLTLEKHQASATSRPSHSSMNLYISHLRICSKMLFELYLCSLQHSFSRHLDGEFFHLFLPITITFKIDNILFCIAQQQVKVHFTASHYLLAPPLVTTPPGPLYWPLLPVSLFSTPSSPLHPTLSIPLPTYHPTQSP